MKTANTSHFGEVPMPQTLIEIFELVNSHAGTRQNIYLWRGQSYIHWKIHSSAYRRLTLDKKDVTEDDMQWYENHLLEHATHQGYRFDEGRRLSDFELLAKLQHHGAATRFVDCSRNMLIALWFACASEPKKEGLLFGLHCDEVGGVENEPEEGAYNEVFQDDLPTTHPQTWQPPVVSKRVAAQGAQFLYSPVVDCQMGSLAITDKPSGWIAMAIAPKIKQKIMKELTGSFDISYLRLFPDIDGFGYANSYRFKQYENERW